jgi:hypothetical protein
MSDREPLAPHDLTESLAWLAELQLLDSSVIATGNEFSDDEAEPGSAPGF